MDKEHLRTGDKATCLFRFIKTPEFIHNNARMVFREGRTKAIGNITRIIPYKQGGLSSIAMNPSLKTKSLQTPKMQGTTGSGKGRRGGRGRKGPNPLPPPVTPVTPANSTVSTTAEVPNERVPSNETQS